LTKIKLIAFDIDGTLTAGGVHLDADGAEEKQFSVVDGLGFRLALDAGFQLAVISGRTSKAVMARMFLLPPENVLLAVRNKETAIALLQERLDVSVAETAFVGDDLNDLPAFDRAGIKIAVANAAPQLKRKADYITKKSGGSGAGREAIEWLLHRQNAYGDAVGQYLKRELSNV
jgi:3-deoxy-D-manno-octulosonate 8-phosphate phosphatase (KDO 8-P phosphatase)